MRRFVVVGGRARSTADFSLDDLPSSSGRLDLLLRCARAALLVSHGVRRDAVVYLVLLGTPGVPRTIRMEGATAQFLRPDERSLARVVQKGLAAAEGHPGPGFGPPKHGLSVAPGGLAVALADAGPGPLYLLDEAAPHDVRSVDLGPDATFVLGDDQGLDAESRAALAAAITIHVGPTSLHADDVIAVLSNELDRQGVGAFGIFRNPPG